MDWKDITLDQFQKIRKLDLSELDGQIGAASIILGIDEDKTSWIEFCKELSNLEFLKNEIPRTIIRKSYVLNGRKYNTRAALNELTVARYMDFTTLAPKGELEKILAVVLIPDGEEYGDYDMEAVYKDILTMSVVDAYAVFNFFRVQFIVCIKTMKDFSVKLLKRDKGLQKVVGQALELALMESSSMSDL